MLDGLHEGIGGLYDLGEIVALLGTLAVLHLLLDGLHLTDHELQIGIGLADLAVELLERAFEGGGGE